MKVRVMMTSRINNTRIVPVEVQPPKPTGEDIRLPPLKFVNVLILPYDTNIWTKIFHV